MNKYINIKDIFSLNTEYKEYILNKKWEIQLGKYIKITKDEYLNIKNNIKIYSEEEIIINKLIGE